VTGSAVVQGRTLTYPIEVRDASSWSAQFLVRAARVRPLLPPGLEPAEPVPGRAMLNIVFVDYRDSDLDAYHEVGIGFLVREPGARRAPVAEVLRQRTGVYIHQLPVDQAFTLEAGRSLWGFPKFMAGIRIEQRANATRCRLEHEGAHVLTIDVASRGRFRMPMPSPDAFTFADGVLRRTPWSLAPGTRSRGRLGGARLTLGNHPLADEVRSLGVPERCFASQIVEPMRARFQEAMVLAS